MNTKIYDYDNNAVEIELRDKPIKEIFVEIESGDEVVTVFYEDGLTDTFDSSDDRCIGYDDGSYSVKGKNIKKWLNWQPEGETTYSYERQGIFDNSHGYPIQLSFIK